MFKRFMLNVLHFNCLGFSTGSILWDDEDKNSNSLGGVLPSGEYGKNTLINYCCRYNVLNQNRCNYDLSCNATHTLLMLSLKFMLISFVCYLDASVIIHLN